LGKAAFRATLRSTVSVDEKRVPIPAKVKKALKEHIGLAGTVGVPG